MRTHKEPSDAQLERQIHRQSGGKYGAVNRCERCQKSAGVHCHSDERCNTLGPGLILCKRCAADCASMDDATYLAQFAATP